MINETPTPTEISLGYCKGETCNRDGCKGIIDEHEKEGSCSCHMHPPCSYCTTDTSYCPECNWEPADYIKPVDPEVEKKNREYWRQQQEKWQEARDSFYKKYNGKEPIDKLEMRTVSHTHFTQKVYGVFPPGTETTTSLLPQVNGTFGGRWEVFNPEIGKFCFVAYTD